MTPGPSSAANDVQPPDYSDYADNLEHILDPIYFLGKQLYTHHNYELSERIRLRYKCSGNTRKMIAKFFLRHYLMKFQQLYRLAVYQHRDESPKHQRAAVFSALYHEMDHIDARPE